MKRIAVFLVLIFSTIGVWAATLTNLVKLQIETEVLTKSKTNIVLAIIMTNVGSTDVFIPSGYLPWDRYAMTLVLAETDPSSTPLKQELVIADPMPGEPQRLKSGETLKGNVDLTDRFPELTKVLRRNDVIVFWSYQLAIEAAVKNGRIAGWKLIPKQSLSASK